MLVLIKLLCCLSVLLLSRSDINRPFGIFLSLPEFCSEQNCGLRIDSTTLRNKLYPVPIYKTSLKKFLYS